MKEHVTWLEEERGEPESFPWVIWFFEGWQVLLVIRLWNIPLSSLIFSLHLGLILISYSLSQQVRLSFNI